MSDIASKLKGVLKERIQKQESDNAREYLSSNQMIANVFYTPERDKHGANTPYDSDTEEYSKPANAESTTAAVPQETNFPASNESDTAVDVDKKTDYKFASSLEKPFRSPQPSDFIFANVDDKTRRFIENAPVTSYADFEKMMDAILGEDNEASEEEILANIEKDDDGEYHIWDLDLGQNKDYASMLAKQYYENHGHWSRFAKDPEYRREYIYDKTGKTEEQFIRERAEQYSRRIDKIEKDLDKVFAEEDRNHPGTAYMSDGDMVDLGRSISKLPAYVALRDIRESVNSLAKDNFWSGFKEGFNIDDMLTYGLSGIASSAEQLRILKKVKNGEPLTDKEAAINDIIQLAQDVDQDRQLFRGEDFFSWNNVGNIVGQMPAFAVQLATTGGIAPIGRKIAAASIKEAFKRSIGSGLKLGAQKFAVSAGNAALQTPLQSMTYQNYIDNRKRQYSYENGILRYAPSNEFSDIWRSFADQFTEVHSETVGDFITRGLTYAGQAIAHTQFANRITGGASSRVAKIISEYRFAPILREIRRRAKISGFVGEVTGEAFGDVENVFLTLDKSRWGELGKSKYWWELIASTAIMTGSFYSMSIPDAYNYGKAYNALAKNAQDILPQIGDNDLRSRLYEAMATDNVKQSCSRLSKIDWNKYSNEDISRAVQYVDRTIRLGMLSSQHNEELRLAQFMPEIGSIMQNSYQGGANGNDAYQTLVAARTDNGKMFAVIAGDYRSSDPNEMVLLRDAATHTTEMMPASRITDYSETSVQDYLSMRYAELFRASIAQERLSEIIKAVENAQANNLSDEQLAQIIKDNGLSIYERGDRVQLASGESGVIENALGTTYLVRMPDNTLRYESFVNILQPDPQTAEAQIMATVSPAQLSQMMPASATPPETLNIGDIVTTADGFTGTISAETAPGRYSAVDDSNNYRELTARDIVEINSSNLASAQNGPQQVQETIAQQADETSIPTDKDGDVDYEKIDDAQILADTLQSDVGSVENAISTLQLQMDKIDREIENLGETTERGNMTQEVKRIKQMEALSRRKDVLSSAMILLRGKAETDSQTTSDTPAADTQSADTAMSRIPKDMHGQPQYELVDADTAWDAIVEQVKGDETIAARIADSMLRDKQEALKRLEKSKPRKGTTVAEKIAAERERMDAIERANADVKAWQRIVAVSQERRQTVEAERMKQAANVKLSNVTDENGLPFVFAPSGALEFGKIDEETGLKPAPILLSKGVVTNPKTKSGYGLAHIEARHGDQIRNAGFKSVVDFIEEVAKNYEQIKEGNIRNGRPTYILQIKDRHNNTLMVELSSDGNYWNINTAGIFKESYGKNKKEVYSRHTTAKQSVETVEASQEVKQSDTTTSSRMNAPTTSSENKDTDITVNSKNTDEKISQAEAEEVRPGLTQAQAQAIITSMEEHAEVAPEMALTIENWDAEFGEDGIVQTPIGKVKMGEHQFTKMLRQDRNGKLGMVKPTLENPNIIVEDSSEAKDGNITERGSSYIYIKAFIKPDGARYYYFTSVTVSRGNMEVVVSNQEKTQKRISNLLQRNAISWINEKVQSASDTQNGKSVSLNDSRTVTKADNSTAPLGINSPGPSENKDSDNYTNTSELGEKIASAETEVNTSPTEKQKEAGNYKKGHVQVGTFDVTIENPKGSVRSGTDANGNAWSITMNNTYGYIRGTEGVDGDHIDVFLSNEIDDWNKERVFVIDQYNEDGTFDEHKVMLGFNDAESAKNNYLHNYSDGWADNRRIDCTSVNIEDFEKWIDSSHRKTKPFTEYKSVNKDAEIPSSQELQREKLDKYTIERRFHKKNGTYIHAVKFTEQMPRERFMELKKRVKDFGGYYSSFGKGGFIFDNEADADKFVQAVLDPTGEQLDDAAPVSIADLREVTVTKSDSDIQPIGHGAFGDIYDQFKGKVRDAIEFLRSHESGDLLGVSHRDGFGDVDYVWGDKSGGLAHIIDKHVGNGKSFPNIDEAAKEIDSIIMNGEVAFENGDKAVFRTGNKLVTVRKNLREKGKKIADKNWVLTAYDETSADNASAISDANQAQAARGTAVSDSKDSKKTTDTQPATENIPPHLLPKMLREAYESGNTEEISRAEAVIREFIMRAGDMRLVIATYDGSRKNALSQEKGSAARRMNEFIAATTKELLKANGMGVLTGTTKKRFEAAKESTDPALLDILADNHDSDVREAAIHNPNTGDETLRRIASHNYDPMYIVAKDVLDARSISRVDAQGNPVDEHGDLRLEKIFSIDELTDVDFTSPARNVELPHLPKNVADAIGTQGKPVIIKKNIFEKNHTAHSELTPEQSRDILGKALYNTTFVGQAQPIRRPDYWVAVQTSDKNAITVLEVNHNKDNVEIVGWRWIDSKGLSKLRRQAEREGGQFLILTSEDAAAALSALPSDMPSANKDSKISANSQPLAGNIEDVGEKIGGARKDIVRELAERHRQVDDNPSDILNDIRLLPVSKVFNFDYAAMRKEGVSNETITLLQVVRDAIPSKPRANYKLKRWADDTFSAYRACLELISADEQVRQMVFDEFMQQDGIGDRLRARMALGGYDAGANLGDASLRQLNNTAGHYDKDGRWVSAEGKWYVNGAGKHGGIYDTIEQATQALRDFAADSSVKPSDRKTRFSVYMARKDGTIFISIKGKPSIVVESGFKSGKEAYTYLKEHYDDLVSKYSEMKERTTVAFQENRPRKGKDWRAGKDISAREFRETFGFRGVEFGNWTNQADRQHALNSAYDALMDLAEATGKSPRAISLNGELGIAFGARGSGNASAHYEPEKIVINLTKTKGAGALAHEWWHAIDNYFSRRRGNRHGYNTDRKGYSYGSSGSYSEQERQVLTQSFTDLMRAIDRSGYGERSRAYAGLKSVYWSRPTELGARAFAVWVERKLSEKGTINDFLANNPSAMGWDSESVARFYPYPIESDFQALDTAFDNLFNTIQEKTDEETGNIVLFNISSLNDGPMTEEQQVVFDAVMGMLDDAGIPVELLTDEQMLQLTGDSEVILQARMNALDKAARTIAGWVKRGVRGKSLTIDLPVSAKTKIRNAMGRDFDSHNITSNSLVHILNNHGENGKKLSDGSIPLREEDLQLIPYIMAAPDRVEKSSTDMSGRESIRFYKDLSNGYVVVVEKEYKNSPDDMETITMWAEKSSAATNAQSDKTAPDTLVRNAIRSTDVAKIRKDAETAMAEDIKSRLMTVYHGSSAEFDTFDHSHMGEGEGAQAYGWGSYVTEVKGIGKSYAKLKQNVRFVGNKEKLREGIEYGYVVEDVIADIVGLMKLGDSFNDAASRVYYSNPYEPTHKSKRAVLSKLTEADFETGRMLYTVEIPENTGKNYLDWENVISDSERESIVKSLSSIDDPDFDYDYFMDKLESYEDEYNLTGKGVYKLLTRYGFNGNIRKASEALHQIGYTGISYPAQSTTGGRSDGARNYVIFDENDLKIKDRIQFMRGKKKTAPETDSSLQDDENQHTAISSTDGTKILNNLDSLAKEYENSPKTEEKTFIGKVANALGINRTGSSSRYVTIETANNQTVTIRLSNHNATVSNIDNVGEAEGISIVVSPKKNAGVRNDGDAHIVEYYYDAIKLRKAEGKPLAEIVRSIKLALHSGEYTDTTGLAQRQEVNGGQNNELRNDVVYGATVGGKIYLNGEHLNPESPIHEYTHIWDIACRKGNPELWGRGVELMKQIPLWDEVKNDPNYVNLNSDDDIASEVHSRLTGKDGAKRLENMAHDAKENGAKELIEKLRQWLNDFWWWFKDTMIPWTREEAERVSLEDFVNMPLRDLANGTRLSSRASFAQRHNISEADVFYMAEDIAMHNQLGINAREDSIVNDTLENVNNHFNQRLDQLINNPNQKDKVLRLGRPGTFLRAGGLEDAEIELEYDILVRKSKDGYKHEHPFDAIDLKDLPIAINSPIATFNNTNGTNDGMVILTEMKKNDRNFIVVVRAQERKRKGGIVLTVNEITTLYPKDARGIVNWINTNRGTNYNKEKVLNWLEALRYHFGTELTNQELSSATKIVKNFENPNVYYQDNTQNQLGDTFIPDRAESDLDATNAKFNEELESLTEKNANSVILSLGLPSDILLAAGIPPREIVLYGNKLLKKARAHEYAVNDIKDLPGYVADPIAVFDGSHDGTLAVLTEMPINGKNSLVSIDIRKGEIQDVNLVTSVFGKNSKGIVNWINTGKLRYADKKKVLNYLSISAPIAEARNNQELSSATKIVKNFENPALLDENTQDDNLYRYIFGGNSGYVGYSKSRRAVDAENRGLRSKSGMDKAFAEKVNSIIEERGGKRVSLAQIKKATDEVKADEWHHTSMYGNRTNYYSAETLADYFIEDPEIAAIEKAFNAVRERYYTAERVLGNYIRDNIANTVVDTEIGEQKGYRTNSGHVAYVDVGNLERTIKISDVRFIEPDGWGGIFVGDYSDAWIDNKDEYETAAEEYINRYRDVFQNAPRELMDEYISSREAYNEASNELYRLREDVPPRKTGVGYKVFVLKDGKLYPPMVANPEGAETPVGVWLDADAAPIAGQSKTGRNQVKAGGKGTQGGSGLLAYRPGWHLGEIPYAIQFNRKDDNGNKTLFPANFVWAEVEYANDVDYQEEAMSYGINPSGKFQHSLAGLPRVPENGSYRYRTNPNPETDPWIITGAMRVKRLLTPSEVDRLVREAGKEPQRRQDGAITDEQINLFNAQNQLGDTFVPDRAESDLNAANAKFNEELQQQIDGTLPKGCLFTGSRHSKLTNRNARFSIGIQSNLRKT